MGNSLISYLDNSLLDMADQRLIFLQEPGSISIDMCRKCGFEILESPVNVGIGKAFSSLVENCRCDKFLFLEEDWVIGCSSRMPREPPGRLRWAKRF